MTMGEIARRLHRVAETGRTSTYSELVGLFAFGTKSERDGALSGLRTAEKKVKAAVAAAREDGKDPVAVIADIIAEAEAKYSAVVGLDAGTDALPSAREDAALIKANRGGEDRDARIAAARESKRLREPLRELLALAGPGKGI